MAYLWGCLNGGALNANLSLDLALPFHKRLGGNFLAEDVGAHIVLLVQAQPNLQKRREATQSKAVKI
eukprot:1159658-Pelagomonas_calceolata.AAC.3